jgi:hypothetical protein
MKVVGLSLPEKKEIVIIVIGRIRVRVRSTKGAKTKNL